MCHFVPLYYAILGSFIIPRFSIFLDDELSDLYRLQVTREFRKERNKG